MSKYGTAMVKNGRYKISGDFHRISPHTTIRDADNYNRLVGITKPGEITHIHSYGSEAVFFEGLGKKIIYGTRCDNPECESQGTVYLPFRIHCPDCLNKNSVVELTDLCRKHARIHTFMVCERAGAFNVLKEPVKFIDVEIEGVSTILMSYLSYGEPEIGMRIIPIFKTIDPGCSILDLSWVPADTYEENIPQGFGF